jgi:hypothetical protein
VCQCRKPVSEDDYRDPEPETNDVLWTLAGSSVTELREALNYIREARHFGKVCLRAEA